MAFAGLKKHARAAAAQAPLPLCGRNIDGRV
jgi:hypothetical protein